MLISSTSRKRCHPNQTGCQTFSCGANFRTRWGRGRSDHEGPQHSRAKHFDSMISGGPGHRRPVHLDPAEKPQQMQVRASPARIRPRSNFKHDATESPHIHRAVHGDLRYGPAQIQRPVFHRIHFVRFHSAAMDDTAVAIAGPANPKIRNQKR